MLFHNGDGRGRSRARRAEQYFELWHAELQKWCPVEAKKLLVEPAGVLQGNRQQWVHSQKSSGLAGFWEGEGGLCVEGGFGRVQDNLQAVLLWRGCTGGFCSETQTLHPAPRDKKNQNRVRRDSKQSL